MDFPEVFGYSRIDSLPLRHRVLWPMKALAQRLDLLPKTMRGKALLRRMLFGRLPRMPRDAPDRVHRFLYVVSTEGRE